MDDGSFISVIEALSAFIGLSFCALAPWAKCLRRMSVSTPRMSGNRKERKAHKSRIWKFPAGLSAKKPLENATDDEELARSFPKTTPADFLYHDSEDDANSSATVEKSGKSFPGSHLSPSQRGNSFSAARRKHAQFANDGYPPSGYLWIWMGVLRRWHRNHFLLETPGVLTHSRRRGSQMRGAFCLRDARVVSSQGHSRQFCIISPAGVAYLRAMAKDQRGQWISSIRESIEKYTQCVEQAESIRASVGTTFMTVEPEEARLENEERDRVHERMSELLPHQAVLKWQMNQLTRKMDAVGGAEPPSSGDYCSMGRCSSTENRAMRRLSTQPGGGLEALDEKRMVRHASLTSELSLPSERSSLHERLPRRVVALQSKVSVDDSTVSTKSSVHVKEMRDRAAARKCQTPRPEGAVRRRMTRRSPRRRTSPREEVDENGKRECGTPRLSMDTFLAPPPPPRTRDLASLNESGMWKSYQNFLDAVQRIVQKEVRSTMELEIENAALRQLLEMRRSETPVAHNHSLHATSGSTSRSYSTAESEFDAALLEQSEDEVIEKKEIRSRDGRTSHEDTNNNHNNRELIDALEVVRRAEYVTRNSSNSEGLVVSLQSVIPPKDSEDDFDEESSNLDQEVYPPSLYSSAEFFVKEGNDMYALEPRHRLPAPRPIQRGFSLWSILKNAIGRDLSRITMPATINEPLSALQRFVEEFEHASFLTSAALSSDPYERLLYVTAFALSSYHGALLRDSKPFNPLLGETFEWSNNQLRFLGEQVSHHPPVSCFHVQGFDDEHENQLYHVQGELELKSKFWGTTLNVFPAGRIELFLETTQERYVWNKASISIHNLVLGQLWLDFHGEIQIKNVTTGDIAKIRLTKARGFGMDRGNLEGKIFNGQKEEVYVVDGNYTKSIYARPSTESHRYEIFRAAELPPDAAEQYNMTPFAVALNDLRGAEPGELPRTDSRFRTDIRALEVGEFGRATSEKLRLEQKQRQTRKVRKENGQKYIPMWFNLRRTDIKDLSRIMDHDQTSVWKFRDEYWKRKEKRNWGGCPDIF